MCRSALVKNTHALIEGWCVVVWRYIKQVAIKFGQNSKQTRFISQSVTTNMESIVAQLPVTWLGDL